MKALCMIITGREQRLVVRVATLRNG